MVTGNNRGKGGATILPAQTNLAHTICAIDQECASTLRMRSSDKCNIHFNIILRYMARPRKTASSCVI